MCKPLFDIHPVTLNHFYNAYDDLLGCVYLLTEMTGFQLPLES